MEALFGQAKKLVMETVGLQSSLEPDAEFSKWMENLKKLESMNHLLRKHFSSYASSMVAMVRQHSVFLCVDPVFVCLFLLISISPDELCPPFFIFDNESFQIPMHLNLEFTGQSVECVGD